MLKIALTLSLTLVTGAGLAAGNSCAPNDVYKGELSYAGLKDHIQKHNVESIDSLLACLPEDCLSSYALVHRGHSPESGSTSYLTPRVILACRQGRLLLAFSGDRARLDNYNKIQVIEFDVTTARYHMHEIQGRTSLPESLLTTNEQPTSCLVCHGQEPHPLWQPYFHWAGLYGADDDVINPEGSEGKHFLAFKKSISPQSRYRFLKNIPKDFVVSKEKAAFEVRDPGVAGYPMFPYRDSGDPFQPRRNLGIGSFISRWNGDRILKQLESSKRFKAVLPQLAWILDCQKLGDNEPTPFLGQPELFGELHRRTLTDIKRRTDEIIADNGRLQRDDDISDAEGLRFSLATDYGLRELMVARMLGVDASNFAMSIQPGSSEFGSGYDFMKKLSLKVFLDLAASDDRYARTFPGNFAAKVDALRASGLKDWEIFYRVNDDVSSSQYQNRCRYLSDLIAHLPKDARDVSPASLVIVEEGKSGASHNK